MKMYIMQVVHCKLNVLVQIMPYNCSQTDYTFSRIRLQQDSALHPDVGFTLRPGFTLRHLYPPTIFFRSTTLRLNSSCQFNSVQLVRQLGLL